MNWLGQVAFKAAYGLYVTRVGRYLHNRHIRQVTLRHCKLSKWEQGGVCVHVLPQASDNFCYVLHAGADVVVVDPADGSDTISFLASLNLTPTAAAITHKHWDHCGGLDDLLQEFPSLRVVGNPVDVIPHLTHPFAHGDSFPVRSRLHCNHVRSALAPSRPSRRHATPAATSAST